MPKCRLGPDNHTLIVPLPGLNLYGDFEVKLFLVLSVLFVWHINGLMAGSRVRRTLEADSDQITLFRASKANWL
jgi:hypothetical protein